MIHIQLAKLAFVGTHTAREIDQMFSNHRKVEDALIEAQMLADVMQHNHLDRTARKMRRLTA